MNEPEVQGQHVLGQVYLKGFAFDNYGKQAVCTLKRGENYTVMRNIKSFIKLDNFFDLPTIPEIDSRSFEKLNMNLEDFYLDILGDLEQKGTLSLQNESYLKQFVANMLCRTKYIRSRIESFYEDPTTKERFLTEISMFLNESQVRTLRLVDTIPPGDRLNYLSIFTMHHFYLVLENFNYCILKDYNDRGWLSSDNPVIIDQNENFSWIIPIEAEIYFPLTKNYCLYLHHPNSENKKSSLRNFTHGIISQVTEQIQESIFEKIHKNANEYVIFPWNLGHTGFS